MAVVPIVPAVSGVPALLRNPELAVQQLVGDSVLSLEDIAEDLGSAITDPVMVVQTLLDGGVRDLVGGFTDTLGNLAGGIFGGFMTGDLIQDFRLGVGQWGVYRGPTPVIVFDSFLGVTYKQDWAIAQYPVERGGFESYDKVDTPFEVQIRFTTGGSVADKAEMLASINAIAGDLNLYDVVTPEAVYSSVNIQRFSYPRSHDHGAGLLTVDMTLLEVRVQGVSDFANNKAPSGAFPIHGGSVQATTAPPSVQNYAGGVT